jgi:hypothetical protein
VAYGTGWLAREILPRHSDCADEEDDVLHIADES